MDEEKKENTENINEETPISNGERPQKPRADEVFATRSFLPIDKPDMVKLAAKAAEPAEPKSDAVKKYLITVIAVVGVFIILSGTLIWAYVNMNRSAQNKNDGGSNTAKQNNLSSPGEVEAAENDGFQDGGDNGGFDFDGLFSPPVKTNVLIIGVDESGYLADVDIVASFDAKRKEVNLLSVPRDTFIQLEQGDIDAIYSRNKAVPRDGQMKLTDLHSYAGKTDGHLYIQKYLEKLLGVTIDYYVKIDLKAFRKIVDEIGGVWFTVRDKGFEYEDNVQVPPVKISVPGGYQLLNGELAEGVVRYRDDYRNGDLDRVLVQQDFMKAFFEQALSKETIVNNFAGYYNVLRDYVQTDFGADKFLLYAEPASKIPSGNFHFYTLPGEAYKTTLHGSPVWFFGPSASKTMQLVSEIFNNFDEPEPTNSPPAQSDAPAEIDVKKMKIQVLNGGTVDGMATKVRDALRAEGYTVTSLGNYPDEKTTQTRIFTRVEANVDELKKFFREAEVSVNAGISDAFDIVVVIGEGER